jgi:hypothetical protein
MCIGDIYYKSLHLGLGPQGAPGHIIIKNINQLTQFINEQLYMNYLTIALSTTINNSKLSILKTQNYLGIAKIKLRALNFNHPLIYKKHQLLSKKNIRRLRNIFKRVGCERLEKENFINTVVDNAALISSLDFLGLNK